MTTIGLLDHMGYGNLGDAAIQETVMANIKRRIPDVEFVGFSLIPEDTTHRHGIPSHPIRWSYPRRGRTSPAALGATRSMSTLRSALKHRRIVHAWAKPLADLVREALFWVRSYRAVKSLDLLVISGGGQLGTTWNGPWAHPYTVFKFSFLAKLARKKLCLLNVGAGPLDHPLARFFARWAVRFADYRSFRDHDSQELMRSLGVRVETQVYPDPVYAFDVGDYLKSGPLGSAAPIVGLNPMGFCDPRIWPRKDDSVYQNYLDKLARFSVWLLEHGYDLRLFTTDVGVDRYALDDLGKRIGRTLPTPDAVCDRSRRPSDGVKDVLREMSAFDFIVTSKFHGIVFSHLLTKPVISLSYHPKMDAAMRAMAQSEFCTDIERFDVEWLIEAFQSLVTESARIRTACATAVKANAAKLSEQFDGLFPPGASSVPRQPV